MFKILENEDKLLTVLNMRKILALIWLCTQLKIVFSAMFVRVSV